MTTKEIFKEMYSAARLWYNAQEINLDARILPNTIPDSHYPFMAWFHWVGLTEYYLFLYEDGRVEFGFKDIDNGNMDEMKLRVA